MANTFISNNPCSERADQLIVTGLMKTKQNEYELIRNKSIHTNKRAD